MSQVYNYRACASLMILGEHAVLYQGWGICAALDQFITVTLIPRDDRSVVIKSSFGTYEGTIDSLTTYQPLSYVLKAIENCSVFITGGFELVIMSSIDPNMGLGSSAAVVVGTLGALSLAFLHTDDKERILKLAVKTVQDVQGSASGCDCAASLYGCLVAFNLRTFEVIEYHHTLEITALYCGYKTQTSIMIDFVKKRMKQYPEYIEKIFLEIQQIVILGMEALAKNDLQRLGELMTAQHYHLKNLGVSNQDLESLFELLRGNKAILGAKISGSGGGDCVIGLGCVLENLPINKEGARTIHLKTLSSYTS